MCVITVVSLIRDHLMKCDTIDKYDALKKFFQGDSSLSFASVE